MSKVPKFIITVLHDFTWVEPSHPHRNCAKNIHVLLSQADDLVERGFVLHIDWKAAFGIIPPSRFFFPSVSENKPSDVSHDTYMFTAMFYCHILLVERVMWSLFLLKLSRLACSEIQGMPGMPVRLPDLARKELNFPLAFS